jgi:hypothetical protein
MKKTKKWVQKNYEKMVIDMCNVYVKLVMLVVACCYEIYVIIWGLTLDSQMKYFLSFKKDITMWRTLMMTKIRKIT